MQVVIANATFREGLFAEISYKGIEWAEVSYDDVEGIFVLTIFAPGGSEDKYVFPLTDVQEALESAKRGIGVLGHEEETG